ncbi:MAG: ASCH domain-containing protein [Pseudomonadota bacterium]
MSADESAPVRRKRLTFWGADEHDDSLPRSVIAGHKTVTADTVEAYYQPYGEYGDGSYAPGDLIEVYDQQRRLRCLIRALDVYKIRFGDVPEAVWRGEAFGSADEFRAVHVQALAPLVLHDDFELVTLHFELVEVVLPFE